MPRQIGLRDIHIALLKTDTDEETTYDAVEKLERAITAKLTPKSSSEKVYSDDEVEEVLSKFDSCDIAVETNQLTLKSRAKLQGAELVNGELIEKSTDIAPEVAIGFRSKKSNGKYKYVWLYKGKFELVEDEYATETDKIESKTPKLKGTFYSRKSDNAWRLTLDEDEEGASTTRIQSWFKTVPTLPTQANG